MQSRGSHILKYNTNILHRVDITLEGRTVTHIVVPHNYTSHVLKFTHESKLNGYSSVTKISTEGISLRIRTNRSRLHIRIVKFCKCGPKRISYRRISK